MKKKTLIIISIIILIIVGGFIGVLTVYSNIQKNLNKLSKAEISNVDLSKVNDGTYTGKYSVFPVTAEVKVTVKDHKITDILLVEHKNGQGSAAEVLPNKVIETQSIKIDSISGATYSSKVILKAIENALSK